MMEERKTLNMKDLEKVTGGYVYYNWLDYTWKAIDDETGEELDSIGGQYYDSRVTYSHHFRLS